MCPLRSRSTTNHAPRTQAHAAAGTSTSATSRPIHPVVLRAPCTVRICIVLVMLVGPPIATRRWVGGRRGVRSASILVQ